MSSGCIERENMSIHFIISANTDIGTVKETNQDSLAVKVISTKQGEMVFALLCDGMGGLSSGEVASASVVMAFDKWVRQRLPLLCHSQLEDGLIRSQWDAVIAGQNAKIKAYGEEHGVRLGTTAVAMLLTQTRYYVLNVGDSRAYEIGDRLVQITRDHSLVAQEVEQGRLTELQAEKSSHRNILTKCVGVSNTVYPEYFFGDIRKNAVYMLCSDGFRHEITQEEMYECFRPEALLSKDHMIGQAAYLTEVDKQRGESDNISVVLIRTF